MAGTGKVNHIQPQPPVRPQPAHQAPKTGQLHAPARPPAAPAHVTRPLPTDRNRAAGEHTSLERHTGKLGGHGLPTPPPEHVSAHAAHERLAHLQASLKQVQTPAQLHQLTRQAHALATEAPGHELQHFGARLARTDAAVTHLHNLENSLHSNGHEKARAIAEALARPGAFKQAIKSLGPLAGSELFAKQQGNARDISANARPEVLGKQLATHPDLAEYGGGRFAANLGKLRSLPDPHLQAGLNKVGEHLLKQSKAAGSPTDDPLALDKVKATPGLGRLIAPLAKSHDPAVREQVAHTVNGWVKQSLENNLQAHTPAPAQHGLFGALTQATQGVADAAAGKSAATPRENALNTFNGFQGDLKQLAKTGLGPEITHAVPQATREVGEGLLKESAAATRPGGNPASDPLSLDRVKANPALGQLLAPLQASKDPGVRQALGRTVQGWVGTSLNRELAANDHPGDPQANAQKTVANFKSGLAELAGQTGLGATIGQVSQTAIQSVATGIANNRKLGLANFKNNPAYGQFLATLNNTPGGQLRVDAKVKSLVASSVDQHLDGKKGEDGVKEALGNVQGDIHALALGGLGPNLQRTAQSAIQSQNDEIKDTINRGKSFFQKLTDGISGVLGDVGHLVGDAIGGVGDLTGGALKGIGLGGAGNFVSGFGHGVGDAVGGTVATLGNSLLHPLSTIKGLGGLVLHPDRLVGIGAAIWKEAAKGGIGHALGFVTGTALTSVLGGGGGVGTLLGKGAGFAESALGNLAAEGSGVLARVGSVGARAVEFGDQLYHDFKPAETAVEDARSLKEVAGEGLSATAKELGSTAKDRAIAFTRQIKGFAGDPAAALRPLSEDLRHPLAAFARERRDVRGAFAGLRANFKAGDAAASADRAYQGLQALQQSRFGQAAKLARSGYKLAWNPARFVAGKLTKRLDRGATRALRFTIGDRGLTWLQKARKSFQHAAAGAGLNVTQAPNLQRDVAGELGFLNNVFG